MTRAQRAPRARAQRGGSGVALGHALIINSVGVFTTQGARVTREPVRDVAMLQGLLDYLFEKLALAPLGAPPQIWLVGTEICERLGLALDYDDPIVLAELDKADNDLDERAIVKQLISDQALAALSFAITGSSEWTLGAGDGRFDGGAMVPLRRKHPDRKYPFRVHLMVEPYMWTMTGHGDHGILGSAAGGTMPPDTEQGTTKVLGHRLEWMTTNLHVLPAITSAATGATLLDDIFRERRTSGTGAIVDTATPLPEEISEQYRMEPEVRWTRQPAREEIDAAGELLTLDQRASYLAAAGTITLGWGTPERRSGAELDEALAAEQLPFGAWRVVLPASEELGLDESLPVPHPKMRRSEPVSAWVTTETLLLLQNGVADGGAGVDLADLDIEAAYLCPHQGRILEAWAKRLREARKSAIASNDEDLKAIVGAIYKGYIGRIANAKYWVSEYKAHHHQPLWRASIIANARTRGRRHAATIAANTGLWPIACHTDSWTYLVPSGLDLADTTGYLGRLSEEKRLTLTDPIREVLAAPSLSLSKIEAFGKPAEESGPDGGDADRAQP